MWLFLSPNFLAMYFSNLRLSLFNVPFFLTSWKKIPRNQRCFGLKETNLFPIFRSRQKPIYLWLSNAWIIPSKKFPWELKVFEILEMYLFNLRILHLSRSSLKLRTGKRISENPWITLKLAEILLILEYFKFVTFLVIKRLGGKQSFDGQGSRKSRINKMSIYVTNIARIVDAVTLNCKVKKIVMNSGSQMSEL